MYDYVLAGIWCDFLYLKRVFDGVTKTASQSWGVTFWNNLLSVGWGFVNQMWADNSYELNIWPSNDNT